MPASLEHSNYSSLIWSLTWPLKTAVSEASLDWRTRVKIAAGAARGIGYLHEDCNIFTKLFLQWSPNVG